MVRNVVSIKVILSCPGDVIKEPLLLEDEIKQINRNIQDKDLQFEVRWWKTDSHPGLNELGPQGKIDLDLNFKDADLIIGIFRTRFGTPTLEANSGTEHEIKLAIKNWEENKTPEVMLYFLSSFEDFYKINFEDLEKIHNFRKEIRKSLYYDYKDLDDFRKKVSADLYDFANKYSSRSLVNTVVEKAVKKKQEV